MINLQEIESEIKDILNGYMKIPSFSQSKDEKEAVDYVIETLKKEPYFKQNPDQLGSYRIFRDPLERTVGYALVLPTEGRDLDKPIKTVCLLHHCDVVGIEDYGTLGEDAFDGEKVERYLLEEWEENKENELIRDLKSGEYLFGRGSCDMKGGGAVQIAITARYSREKFRPGALLLLCVPDEENLSAGMRGGMPLLSELRKKYCLDYRMMINSEPNQHVISEGSIGKMMPFLYVDGVVSHVGSIFQGANPVNILSKIVEKIDMSMEFCEQDGDEVTPPPTWLFAKDRKKTYDVSIPKAACGSFNLLSFSMGPKEVIKRMERISIRCMEDFYKERRTAFARYEKMGGTGKLMEWEPCVLSFGGLFEEVRKSQNDSRRFQKMWEKKLEEIREELVKGESNLIEETFSAVEFLLEQWKENVPKIIYGLIPPYYPSVSNRRNAGLTKVQKEAGKETAERMGYRLEQYFKGISDLSYTSLENPLDMDRILKETMPFYPNLYQIPVKEMGENQMPCLNIGPLGKDLHQRTERIWKKDLYENLAKGIGETIEKLWADPE